MRGNENVIQQLNEALKAELTAIVQYMVHSEMCQNWGYRRLGAYVKKQAIDEMKHAEGLIERILFLDGSPKVDLGLAPKIGDSVAAQLAIDLGAELEAVKQYNASARVCAEADDHSSRDLFTKMVKDEEEHADFLETQISIIKEIGLDNYLSQQMHGSERS